MREMAGENIVALVDVDYKKAANTFKAYPKSEKFKDYRVMLDRMGKSVDAVMIATPDHMHAPIAMEAMRHNLPVYGQKPLAHDIYEVRRLTEYARKKKLVWQQHSGWALEGVS